MKYLAKKHAEVRLSAFQVLNELFIRSNQFRELALADFKKLALLVTGTDAAHPLPPPKEAATKLKKESLLAIKEWNQKFGSGYQELRLGYNYLKYNKKVCASIARFDASTNQSHYFKIVRFFSQLLHLQRSCYLAKYYGILPALAFCDCTCLT